MLNLLSPKMYCNSIYEIDLKYLHTEGIRAILFDLDNTLVPWNSNEFSKELIEWFAKAKQMGFKTCVVSNNHVPRVSIVTDVLEIPVIANAGKPSGRGLRQAISRFSLAPKQVALVGDQIFTDILGGNRLNLFTVLVNPMSNNEFIGTKALRIAEVCLFGSHRQKLKNIKNNISLP